MSTLYAMTMRILDEINRTDLSDQAADAVKTAIQYYGNRSWGFNETLTSITLVAGTYRYALPSDFVSEITVGVDENSRRSLLCKKTVAEFEDGFDTTHQACPSEYVTFGDAIQLWPIPDETYSCVMTYVHTLPELTLSGSNAWTTECEEMIRMRAEADLLENLVRGEEAAQQAIICRARESEIYREIRPKRDRSTNTGKIRRRGNL